MIVEVEAMMLLSIVNLVTSEADLDCGCLGRNIYAAGVLFGGLQTLFQLVREWIEDDRESGFPLKSLASSANTRIPPFASSVIS